MKFKKFLTSASLVLLAVVGMFCFVGCGGTPVEPQVVQEYLNVAETTTINNGYKMNVTLKTSFGNIDGEMAYLSTLENGMQFAADITLNAAGEDISVKMYATNGWTYYDVNGEKYKEEGFSADVDLIDISPEAYFDMIINAVEEMVGVQELPKGASIKQYGDLESGDVKFVFAGKAEGASSKIVLRFEDNALVEMRMTAEYEGMKADITIETVDTISLPSANELAAWGV